MAKLEAWFVKNARKLPWRTTSDPYSIWISEVMLQQTQVTTVIPYYHAFLSDFPTVEVLANAPLDKVLSRWSGLGYYSRAKNLQKGAQHVLAHGGVFPKSRESLLAVPGIGPYTAGAIASIAFDLPVPIVDGNVQRVFSRYFGWKKPLGSKESMDFFWKRAQEAVDLAKSPRHLNQALMELGATICTKGTPLCEQCPLRLSCVAFAKGLQTQLPVKSPKRIYKELFWLVPIFEQDKKWLLRQNEDGEWWSGLWDFPREDHASPDALQDRLLSLHQQYGKRKITLLNTQKHTVTHHRIRINPVLIHAKPKTSTKSRWVEKTQVPSLPVSSLVKKILSSIPF